MTHPLQLSPDYVKLEKKVAKVQPTIKRKRKTKVVAPKVILNSKEIIQALKKVKDKGISIFDLQSKEVLYELYIVQRFKRYQIAGIINTNENRVSTRLRAFGIKKHETIKRRSRRKTCQT